MGWRPLVGWRPLLVMLLVGWRPSAAQPCAERGELEFQVWKDVFGGSQREDVIFGAPAATWNSWLYHVGLLGPRKAGSPGQAFWGVLGTPQASPRGAPQVHLYFPAKWRVSVATCAKRLLRGRRADRL